MEDEFINESDSIEIEDDEINEPNDPFDIDINIFKVPNIVEIFQNHNIMLENEQLHNLLFLLLVN